jgi:hypothetical protein
MEIAGQQVAHRESSIPRSSRIMGTKNHNLERNPRSKRANWSTVDDALLFHLASRSVGNIKWTGISKLFSGNMTDKEVKHRFYYMKRRFESLVANRANETEVGEMEARLRQCRLFRGAKADKSVLEYMVAHSLDRSHSRMQDEQAFGPFRESETDRDVYCFRCSLAIPSLQTGRLVCKTTGWCEHCTKVLPCISDDFLRLLHCFGKQSIPIDDLESKT